MALDITIIDNHAIPHHSIPVGIKTHANIFRLLDDEEFPFCTRMRNYYEDANYNSYEVPSLLKEILNLKAIFSEEKLEYHHEAVEFLKNFEDLCLEAISKDFSISAIAG